MVVDPTEALEKFYWDEAIGSFMQWRNTTYVKLYSHHYDAWLDHSKKFPYAFTFDFTQKPSPVPSDLQIQKCKKSSQRSTQCTQDCSRDKGKNVAGQAGINLGKNEVAKDLSDCVSRKNSKTCSGEWKPSMLESLIFLLHFLFSCFICLATVLQKLDRKTKPAYVLYYFNKSWWWLWTGR